MLARLDDKVLLNLSSLMKKKVNQYTACQNQKNNEILRTMSPSFLSLQLFAVWKNAENLVTNRELWSHRRTAKDLREMPDEPRNHSLDSGLSQSNSIQFQNGRCHLDGGLNQRNS